MSNCSVTEEDCFGFASALGPNLRELNLSGRKLGDSGVHILCNLLGGSYCKLEKLDMSNCSITDGGCLDFASALGPNLRELNLSGNKLGDAGVNILCNLLGDPSCKLEKLDMSNCSITEGGCLGFASALGSNLRELNLSGNKLGDAGVNILCNLLGNPYCKLEKLDMSNCSITEGGCLGFASALGSNLRELNLSGNKLGDAGVNILCNLLGNPYCKLEKLDMSNCSITDGGCLGFTSALGSNLRELNLSGNELGDAGVNILYNLLENPYCKLEKLEGVVFLSKSNLKLF